MSTTKGNLARKLAKIGNVQKLHSAETKSSADVSVVADIEEFPAVRTIKSQFFSPVQTRRQRINNFNPPKQLEPKEKNQGKRLSKPVLLKGKPEVLVKELTSTSSAENELKLNIKSSKPTLTKKEIDCATASCSSASQASLLQWTPKHWHQQLANIRQMRSSSIAPVDSMGCHKCSDEDADEKTQRFHKLVALMLSSQTKDETTFEAMQRLKAEELTPHSIVTMEPSKLQQLLCPVSFYKNKAKYLQQASQLLIEKYNSDIPSNVKALESLPGVGPKMAHICMATAWNEVTGIGVDVHVHRITNRLRWTQAATKTPEQTRLALESWLPRDMWREVNHLLVGFGQTVCTPIRPHCVECLNRDICPAADVSGAKKKTPIKRKSSEKK